MDVIIFFSFVIQRRDVIHEVGHAVIADEGVGISWPGSERILVNPIHIPIEPVCTILRVNGISTPWPTTPLHAVLLDHAIHPRIEQKCVEQHRGARFHILVSSAIIQVKQCVDERPGIVLAIHFAGKTVMPVGFGEIIHFPHQEVPR